MSIDRVVTVRCDLKDCKSSLTWSETKVAAQQEAAPEESQYLVIFTQNGAQKTFCGQLHAALYFLPPGYEVQQKKVVPIPEKPGWREEPSPENGQPEPGFCECGHPLDLHNGNGCLVIFSNKPGDFCKCEKPEPEATA